MIKSLYTLNIDWITWYSGGRSLKLVITTDSDTDFNRHMLFESLKRIFTAVFIIFITVKLIDYEPIFCNATKNIEIIEKAQFIFSSAQ
jgi:hypothetical protein